MRKLLILLKENVSLITSKRNPSALILWIMKRKILPFVCLGQTHLWPFSKSKCNVKSDRVNLVAPASPIKCLLYLPNGRTKQYKLGPEKLTRLGNSNVLRLPVFSLFPSLSLHCKKTDGHWQRWVLTTSFFQAPGINFP